MADLFQTTTARIADVSPVVGEAPAFMAMLEHVSHVAPLDKPILVIGERGTGKEIVATRLHFLSRRWEQPLVKLNCAVLTESLLESELFGHEAGAFTGAAQRHIGRFERADGGTLFLDELATIPMRMQEKILSVIEYGKFERVGGSDTITTDVRIVGATNADLPALSRAGEFRPDLLDRLAFDVITVPPLRVRRSDILLLAEHFALNITRELGRALFAGFDESAERALLEYSWPGNVRELKNVIERSVYRHVDPETPIEVIEFDPFKTAYSKPAATQEEAALGTEPPTEPPLTIALPINLKSHIAEREVELIGQAMHEARYNQRRAAELLTLSYHQLRALLRKHDLVQRYGRSRTKAYKH